MGLILFRLTIEATSSSFGHAVFAVIFQEFRQTFAGDGYGVRLFSLLYSYYVKMSEWNLFFPRFSRFGI